MVVVGIAFADLDAVHGIGQEPEWAWAIRMAGPLHRLELGAPLLGIDRLGIDLEEVRLGVGMVVLLYFGD